MFRGKLPLRVKLIESYSKAINYHPNLPTIISSEQFVSSMTKWLSYANISYAEKGNKGIYYPEDYVNKYGNGAGSTKISGVTNHHYWNLQLHKWYFKADKIIMPSCALQAFFEGPTIAECASVMQACVYKAIEEMIGTETFDHSFSSPLIPFLITRQLYHKIYSHAEKPAYSKDERMYDGNPIYFLFDDLSTLEEKDIQIGDILGIGGVDKYPMKHLVGSGQGWNVICVGKNEAGENLYWAFGPINFQKPLTYQQIKSLLIHSYNADPSIDSKKKIESLKTKDVLKLIEANTAEMLANNKVNENYPILGIHLVIRFNLEKLKNFISQKEAVWYEVDLAHAERSRKENRTPVNEITPFSAECRGKTFEHYHAETPVQQQMLTLAKKFAHAVCRREPAIGLVMTGMPGIGKTHLSVAVANEVAEYGLKVVFLDAEFVGNSYQKMCEQQHGQLSDVEIDKQFNAWLQDADLIVFDDINSAYGSDAQFLRKAIKYVTQHKKAILVSGNQPVTLIQESVHDYIGYDNCSRNNFYVMQDIKGKSYRKNWWSQGSLVAPSNPLATNQDALVMFAQLKNEQAAGLILIEKNPNMNQLADAYLRAAPNLNERVRIILSPYKNNRVYDSYVHDFAEYDLFLIKVNEVFEAEQLLNLIAHVHDLGKKIMVITENENQLFELIKQALSFSSLANLSIRLQDRAENILLKKSDWPTLAITKVDVSQNSTINNELITIGPEKYNQKQKEIAQEKNKLALKSNTFWRTVPDNNKKKNEKVEKAVEANVLRRYRQRRI